MVLGNIYQFKPRLMKINYICVIWLQFYFLHHIRLLVAKDTILYFVYTLLKLRIKTYIVMQFLVFIGPRTGETGGDYTAVLFIAVSRSLFSLIGDLIGNLMCSSILRNYS